MRRRRTWLAAAASALVLVTAAPAAAAPVIDQVDERGDVRLHRGGDLTRAQRTSIDVRRLVVARVPETNRVRITVQIRDVMRVRKFDQMFFITGSPPDGGPGERTLQVGFTTNGDYGYATVGKPDGSDMQWCDIRRVTVRPRQDTAAVLVPLRCLPADPVEVELDAYTGTFRSDGPTYSSDSLTVPGAHFLRG